MSRIEIIERLAKSLRTEDNIKEKNFYESFGAFVSSKSAEEIVSDIKIENWFERA